ncbi:DUF134 domain-containing protein [Patescibacteria group bacterium]|nr:DUF134 domain-containing protein [Patescibacteria group bacterium]MCG2702393.1 DUF134 domain-containing protein [Candidatus Parcubacteria bacterium]MBU4264836.1 DUF134 domain-containing protein [Patescibacteria group bacterium]MBU4389707.1 DUF134 domain-containing protein [Patescibacteria group bacterium]MBU4397402.1 DUF134 domain-containing protein [Patescibacteria group bacterium]
MRRRCKRKIRFNFREIYFKPRGIPLSQLKEVSITEDELEALRLRYVEKLDQHESAKKMGISQSQYQRDITLAFEKITKALIEGWAIKIEKRLR